MPEIVRKRADIFARLIFKIDAVTQDRARVASVGGFVRAREEPKLVLDKTKIKATYNIEVPYWEESLAECISKLDK